MEQGTAVSVRVRDGRSMRTPIWGHQAAAIDFLQAALGRYKAAMLAMGMGTGKSWVTVSMAANLDVHTVLIACPLRVVDVWPKEFREHCGLLNVNVITLGDDAGSVAEKQKHAEQQLQLCRVRSERAVLVVNYESAWREPFASWALDREWGLVVCDESHRIKQASGKASKFFGRLGPRARYRLCLTGTPLPHSPLDIFGQFRFLAPQIFGPNYYAFKQSYAVMGGFLRKQVVDFRDLDILEAKMRQITFRVGKEVLDLPPETHTTLHCQLEGEGLRVYRDLEKDFCSAVLNGTVVAANALVKLLRLQQVTGGHIKLDDGRIKEIDDSKARLLADTLEDIAPDEPIVIWCRFRADIDTVRRVCEEMKRGIAELSGERSDLKEWQDGGAPILIAQISAGGVGVDLTRARYSIYYSIGFSLGEYDQSLSRIHRPKQVRPVTHLHLISKGTVDEKIARALDKRQDLVETILNEIRSNHESQVPPITRAS